MNNIQKHYLWIVPLLLLLIITPWLSEWDLALSNKFFHPEGTSDIQHKESAPYFESNALSHFLYTYGEWPAFIAAGLSLFIFLFSYFSANLRKWRPIAVGLVIVMILIPGVIVNGVFKEIWGRPRPKQITEFGGDQSFRPYYSPNFTSNVPAKSFPSGHATMGFYFLAVAFAGYQFKKKWLFRLGVILTLFLGLGLGYARISQGGHFLSDVIVAALLVWLGTVATFHFLKEYRT